MVWLESVPVNELWHEMATIAVTAEWNASSPTLDMKQVGWPEDFRSHETARLEKLKELGTWVRAKVGVRGKRQSTWKSVTNLPAVDSFFSFYSHSSIITIRSKQSIIDIGVVWPSTVWNSNLISDTDTVSLTKSIIVPCPLPTTHRSRTKMQEDAKELLLPAKNASKVPPHLKYRSCFLLGMCKSQLTHWWSLTTYYRIAYMYGRWMRFFKSSEPGHRERPCSSSASCAPLVCSSDTSSPGVSRKPQPASSPHWLFLRAPWLPREPQRTHQRHEEAGLDSPLWSAS